MGNVIEFRPRPATPATTTQPPNRGPAKSLKKRLYRAWQTLTVGCSYHYRLSTVMGVVRVKSVRMTPRNYLINLLVLRRKFPVPHRKRVK